MVGLLASSILGLGVSAGIGSSYDYVGIRIDLHVWHVALSAALGTSGVGYFDEASYGVRNVQVAPALGLRAYSGGDRDGFVLAATWSGHRYERSYDNSFSFDPTARMDIFTVTAGWRFRWDTGWFVESCVGGGVVSQSGHPSATGHDSIPGPYQRWGRNIFDVGIGAGFQF
jgi:hypothetical protein